MVDPCISADEAHDLRKDHLCQGPDGKERLLKVAQAPSSWNPGTRSARFVMTSQAKDRYGDVVVTGGLDTAQFEKNPIALLSHRSDTWPIGDWMNVEKQLRGRPPRMEGDLVLHKSGGPIPEIDQAAWMIENGYMRGASIGFLPDWNAIEKVLEGDGAWNGGLQFNQAEIVECSLCGIPANPQALAKSVDGDIRIARELIEDVLDNWARSPEGVLVPREEFEKAYRVLSSEDLPALADEVAAEQGMVLMSRERVDRIERAARNQRKAEQRAREIEAIRLRGIVAGV